MFGLPIGHISILLLIPVLGAGLLVFVPRSQIRLLFTLATLASGLDFLWSVKIVALFDGASGEMQLVERAPWMPGFGIQYLVGIDGISLFLVLLTTLLMPVAMLASWSVKERLKEYLIFMLLLETGMLGAFVALDLFLFYVFWEVMLVPMYFLIGVWGGTRRIYAALKFVVYTMSGSLLMLVAIIYLATQHAQVEQALTFDVLKLYGLHLPFDQQIWLFLAFALSFAIKVPLFPFHTWLPDAHVEAPTAGSVILAGVLLKLGTYGFLRFAMPLSRRSDRRRADHRYPRGDRDNLWRSGGDDAERHQEISCLFLGQPSRFRDARLVRAQYPGNPRQRLSNAQPWTFHRRAISFGRYDL